MTPGAGPGAGDGRQTILHATAVALDGRALVIRGAAGRGKSTLALDMMSRGAVLVADDRVCLRGSPSGLLASSPAAIRGLIEARGLGILDVPHAPETPVMAVVDLDRRSDSRLPELRTETILGQTVPLLCRIDGPYFGAILLQYLRHGPPRNS